MIIRINEKNIPGTVLDRKAMGNVTGLDFLNKIFYISDGIMLTQIREVAGIDGTTLQNWTKRGWVENPKSKKYNIDQLAHILIINMLRSCMRLDRIAFLVSYINGRVYDRSDDIIRDSILYDYICRLLDRLMSDEDLPGSKETLRLCICEVISDYEEKIPGAKNRLTTALEIIVIAYYASLIKGQSDAMLEMLING